MGILYYFEAFHRVGSIKMVNILSAFGLQFKLNLWLLSSTNYGFIIIHYWNNNILTKKEWEKKYMLATEKFQRIQLCFETNQFPSINQFFSVQKIYFNPSFIQIIALYIFNIYFAGTFLLLNLLFSAELSALLLHTNILNLYNSTEVILKIQRILSTPLKSNLLKFLFTIWQEWANVLRTYRW